jgi:hypothetical protein
MKKIALPLIAVLALASSAFAGHEVKETKDYKAPVEPCFKDQELQLDIFGNWTEATNNNRNANGFGGGAGVNYFFMKYLGLGVDGAVRDGGRRAVADFSGRLIARFPIEMGSLCLAPYVFGGGGLEFDDVTVGTWHAGGGLEWRVTHQVGVFGEGRYTWGGNDVDSAQARLGVRIVF